MQTILCKLLLYIFLHITGVYDPLYSAVHPMKYLESDVMWCNKFVMEIAIFK